ncbi:unnamed protein product [Cuscuta campestris]|uniref:non-specific serine/threonine protein kinase n=1 Tax=Cuscuta campestris TaxID=132261 RepID=A0A484L8Z8_9ASTE|nr:unnamed protein product [Cuscuta campestris]
MFSAYYLFLLVFYLVLCKDPLNTFRDWEVAGNENVSSLVWCGWSGVECGQYGHVTALDLSRRNLSGIFPASFRHLLRLRHLNLSGNLFDCPMPPPVLELPGLTTLDISNNSFGPTLPPAVSRLRSLSVFNAFSNNFSGPLPGEIVSLKNLEYLNLGGSYFSGEIPASYGSLSNLKFLYLAGNLLTGAIPPELGLLKHLENLLIGYNEYSGGIPVEIFTLHNLTYLDISQANLSGHLSPQISNLTKLKILYLFKNGLTGEIPGELSRLTLLKELDLSSNYFSGHIPATLSSLEKLSILSLLGNNLTGEIPPGIGQLPCLERLSLWNNSLTGILPQKLGSNSRLVKMDVSSCSLSGPIPPGLCLGKKLEKLILFSNQFSGAIPATLANCTSLTRLRVQDNRLNGSIPAGFGSLPNLTFLDLSLNNLSGAIPEDFGNAVRLQFLNISGNQFHSGLPENIWSAPDLNIFSASHSAIQGKIPDFRGCHSLYKIELEGNNLTGDIPPDVQHCEKLISLNFRRNSLSGIIPWEISSLPSLTDLDLSHNLLSGTISSNFGGTRTLESFNVSYNRLVGPIPSGQVFSSLHASSFTGNDGLCGSIIKRSCRNEPATSMDINQPHKRTTRKVVYIVIATFGICVFVLVVALRCLRASYDLRFPDDREPDPWKLTAYQRLNFTAEDVLDSVKDCDKVIGSGSTGTVYKVEMPSGEIIAIKKLHNLQKDTIRIKKGVLAEVEVLSKIKHRNIVRLLGCCATDDCALLLYEYMPNGSLDDLLHGKNKNMSSMVADWVTRYEIALGVAQGISYLHHDCDPIVLHRDLKPSNILLDDKNVARVADFGVAKLFQGDECTVSIIAGSYGYIAPEYAYSLQVDAKSDIYSYGVMLLEILTGRRSMESEFGEGNSIVDWVRSKLNAKNDMKEIFFDKYDLSSNSSCSSTSSPLVMEEMMLLLNIALLCTRRNPADRPSMREVVSMLIDVKPKRKLLGESGGCGDDAMGNGGDDDSHVPDNQITSVDDE